MLQRAYSILSIKSIDEETRVISGLASTPEVDRMGDILEPKGAEYKLPIPLLWHHNSREPIGEVFAATVTKAGIEIKARLVKVDEPGALKDRLDTAWQSIKAGLVKGLSVGFDAIESARIEGTYGYRFIKWAWLELSAVTIPANASASISTIKSHDIGRAATGTRADLDRHTSGVSDRSRVVSMRSAGSPMKKTYADQIAGFEATRQAKSAEMDAIMEAAGDAGETLDAAGKERYDTLVAEVKEVDEHLVRLRDAEVRSKATAKPIAGGTAEEAAASRQGSSIITLKKQLPPGIRFARAAMCIAASKGSRGDALALADEAYPDDPGIVSFIKAAVGAATTANNQGPAVQYTDVVDDFIDYLRPGSIVGKFGTTINGVTIPALKRVGFNTRTGSMTTGGTGYWVGQGLPKPLTKQVFSTMTVDFAKVATIVVLTKEEVRFSAPSAEAKVRDDMAAAINAAIDIAFIDPANAGTANVKPAAVTNGVIATAVSGTTEAAFRVDFKNLMSAMITANISPTSGVLIMSATMALNLSLMRNALAQDSFPNLTMNGGRLFGFPVIVSEYLTAYGSPSTQLIVLVNANDIALADDGNVTIDSSDQASVEMLDGSLVQDATAGTGASLVSLWQSNLLGLRAEREITWKKRRTAAAAYLSPVAYVPS